MFCLRYLILLCLFMKFTKAKEDITLYVFTVATEDTDGYKRFMSSAKYFGYTVNRLGVNQKWIGGGQKLNILKEALEPIKDDKRALAIITDSYDVVFVQEFRKVLQKFQITGAKVLFGAENYCWPDEILKNEYPIYIANKTNYLNSGLMIGYCSEIYGILNTSKIEDTDNDQLFLTKVFLNKKLRKKYGMALDYTSDIFLNMNSAQDAVYQVENGMASIHNKFFLNYPSVIHGCRGSKILFNGVANYFGGNFVDGECRICQEDLVELVDDKLPIITLAVFINDLIPDFPNAFDKIAFLDYPKKNIDIYFYSKVLDHDQLILDYIENFGDKYRNVKSIVKRNKDISEKDAKIDLLEFVKEHKSDYVFYLESNVRLNNPGVLKELLTYNRSFIAPLLVKKDSIWSNFWGGIDDNGFYMRSGDYISIAKRNIRGMWNVPYVSSCYLMKSSAFEKINYENYEKDLDMKLCEHLRSLEIFMYIINTNYYGDLIDNTELNTRSPVPLMYSLFTDREKWEKAYIHSDYWKNLQPGTIHTEVCPDVYQFPVLTNKFCDDLIEIMEDYGQWSHGKNEDDRVPGGYENHPTRDIQMYQVGLDAVWMKFLEDYIRPLQETVFFGFSEPVDTFMKFVVRYKPDEQPFLREHYDASTYTINIALNEVGKDYSGGGCRFSRYNCSVVDTKKGWVLMHPGRVTHMHEGLSTTAGTRYIFITFINP